MPEPTLTSTVLPTTSCNSVCSTDLMVRVMLALARYLFSEDQAPNIPNDRLQDLIWSASSSQSLISIEDIGRYDTQQTEKRPAILVQQGELEWQRLGINNMLMPVDPEAGRQYGGYWSGQITLHCNAGESNLSRLLACAVERYITGYHADIRRIVGLYRFEPGRVGRTTPVEEAKQRWTTPVTYKYALPQDWVVAVAGDPYEGTGVTLTFS